MSLFENSSLTKDVCFDLAQKCSSIGQFQELYPSAFTEAQKKGFIREITQIYAADQEFVELTYDQVMVIASRYKFITHFKRQELEAYKAAMSNDWLSSITQKLWTKSTFLDSIVEKAKSNFETVTEWKKEHRELANELMSLGYSKEFCNAFHNDMNYETALNEAHKYTSEKQWKEQSPSTYEWAVINRVKGKITEARKAKQGNKAKFKFDGTYDTACIIASQCATMPELKKKSRGVHDFIVSNGHEKKLCSHFQSNTTKNYWSEERLREVSGRYFDLSDFMTNEKNAYDAASKKGILHQITSHMNRVKHSNYSIESAIEAAKKYNSLSELIANQSGLYNHMLVNNIVEQVVQAAGLQRNQILSKEYCRKISLTCSSLDELRSNYQTVLSKMYVEGWFDELTSHINRSRIKRGHWQSKERCFEVFKQHNGDMERIKKEFSGCATSIRRNDWLEEFRAINQS
ncbi:hypothetical protein DET48_112122 [Vibrio diazotrophicus]|jgi:hypothetical protein|uniref:Uncharacterized protein n=1 Tax=Vibrio diazotrophicus TaxID=685 RepID=A0A329EA79_VIBDI|nr:hypothetical protein [Vibrio diazotrophicus]RAS63440.1 hypothetical protein DET48_112122 [Vibrio diazotrophicus]